MGRGDDGTGMDGTRYGSLPKLPCTVVRYPSVGKGKERKGKVR